MGGKPAAVAARPWHPWLSLEAGKERAGAQMIGSECLVRSTGSGSKPSTSPSPFGE